MPDKVMKPENKSNVGDTAKQVKSSIIEGPTASSENLTPFNRSEKK